MSDSRTRILVGAPCYGGQLYNSFMSSLMESIKSLNEAGIEVRTSFTTNESLITRARNTIVAKFLSDPSLTHLLFIDADIQWNPGHTEIINGQPRRIPGDIEKLVMADKDIVGGAYPKKGYNWSNLKKDTVLQLLNECPANEDGSLPNDVVNFIRANLMGYVVNHVPGNGQILNNLLEVAYIGTGFMMIKRHVFEKMIAGPYANTKYVDDIGMLVGHERDNAYCLFNADVHYDEQLKGPRYLSEDYLFCKRWLDMGGKIYVDVTIDLTHIGTHHFNGQFLSTLSIDGTNPYLKRMMDSIEQKKKTLTDSPASPSPPTPEPTPENLCVAERVYNRKKGSYIFPQNPITDLNVKERVTEFLNNIPTYPNRFKGRGIVICAGGEKYIYDTYRILRILRDKLGCTLPIEWFYVGTEELNGKQKAYLEKNLAPLRCIDVLTEPIPMNHEKPIKLKGYEIKPYALLISSFEEIILIDADNIPLQNVEKLYDMELYKKSGAVFWPDYWTNWYNPAIYEKLGVNSINGISDPESGQMVVNKQRCWAAINMTWFLNHHSYYFYKYCMGDKDTYRLGWVLTGTEYTQNPHQPQAIGPELKTRNELKPIFCGTSMIHFDESRTPMFAHMTLERKLTTQNDALLRWEKISNNQLNTWNIHPTGRYILIKDANKMKEPYQDIPANILDIKKYFESIHFENSDLKP